MRWSLKLLSPSVVADGPDGLVLGPDEAGREAQVAVSVVGGVLEIAADVRGAAGVSPGPGHPEWHWRAHLAALINPGHDHATRWL
ncbi:hypothetical protein LCGC14_2795300, partial [marine sediment metagenome]